MDEFTQDSSSKIQVFTTVDKSILNSILENKVTKYSGLGIFFILILNAIVVDILFFSSLTKNSKENLALQQISAICPQSCVTRFSQFTAKQSSQSAATTSAQIQTPTPTPTPTLTPSPTITPTPTPALREYFIPLGQGSGSYTDWTVVPGIGAKITVTNYGKIEKVYFEATIRVPAGSQVVYVRLYNTNSLQAISNSDLALSSNTSTLLTSKEISLTDTKDENLYQVQLKTQLGSTTYIDQARLHIFAR